jgi:hypothetical protein
MRLPKSNAISLWRQLPGRLRTSYQRRQWAQFTVAFISESQHCLGHIIEPFESPSR